MGKCKNIECSNETEGKKLYCSLTCRNYYVNKYLRDYNKNGSAISEKYRTLYLLNPKKCKNCSNDISYEYRESDYCSKKCSSACINLNRNGTKYNMSVEGLSNIIKTNREKTGYKVGEYESNPNICVNCNLPLDFSKRFRKCCSKKCLTEYGRKNMVEYLIYKSDASFKFSLNDYPDKFDFSLIEKHGWYSPSNSKKPNINGVSRDHMISIKDGFRFGIDPKLIAHPANCKLMVHSENISKNKNSSITIEELIERINNWGNSLMG